MGYEKVTVGYSGEKNNEEWAETQWQIDNDLWLDEVRLTDVGDYYVNVSKNEFFKIDRMELWYGEWNNLMEVIDKIESMGFLTSLMTVNPKPLQEIGFSVGSHVFGIYKGNLQFDNDNESTKKCAVYDTIIKFINWYNKNKENDLSLL